MPLCQTIKGVGEDKMEESSVPLSNINKKEKFMRGSSREIFYARLKWFSPVSQRFSTEIAENKETITNNASRVLRW